MGVGGPWKSPSVMFCVHVLILWRRINGDFGVPDRIELGEMKERFFCRRDTCENSTARIPKEQSKLHG